MTPKNLLIDRKHISIHDGELFINAPSQFTTQERTYLELIYNYAWGGGGNRCSVEFVEFISLMPESMKRQLLKCGFIDNGFMEYHLDEGIVFKRFVDERVVAFEGKYVLASVWDLVNHSSFSPPIRITPHGVETPPINPGSNEVLHKYNSRNSPIGVWKKYGFACRCVIAYSIPFDIQIGNQKLNVRCYGQLDYGVKARSPFSVVGDTLTIKSLPVGCFYKRLPFENFKSILSSTGFSVDVANKLFSKILELNLKARHDLVKTLRDSALGLQKELLKTLMYEIELIDDSVII